MPIGIQNLNICILLDASGGYLALSGRLNANRFGGIGIELRSNALNVQHNFGNVFFYAVNCGELVHYAVNFNAGYSNAGQAGKQHTPQAVAQSCTEASLQRLYHKLTVAAICGEAGGVDLGSFDLHHGKNPP